MFFSGGGKPWVAETCLRKAAVMLSYYVQVKVKDNKPDSRLGKLFEAKKEKIQQHSPREDKS